MHYIRLFVTSDVKRCS